MNLKKTRTTAPAPAPMIPGVCTIKPNHDREMLRLRHIKSPDISKMKLRVYDPAQKTTIYFANAERYNRYMERTANPQTVISSLKKGGRQSKRA